MNDCRRFHESLQRQANGEASPEESEALARHCNACQKCRALQQADTELRLAAAIEPDRAGLAEVRRAVLRQARLESQQPPLPWWWMPRRQRFAVAAAVLVLALTGFVVGRSSGRAADRAELAIQVRSLATPAKYAGTDPLDSPFIYSNVRFAADPHHDRLRLDFDVSAHLEIERPLHDPLVAEVVAQTLLAGTSPLGSRLKAAALAAHLTDRRVRRALLTVLVSDPSPVVRRSALLALLPDRADTAVKAVVLRSLASETSAPLRLLAVDFLAGSVDRATLLRAVDANAGDSRAALQARAAHDLTTH